MTAVGRPTALVVYESLFENTETIARAVARGLVLEGFLTTTACVASAPPLARVQSDLVVVGAPTHAFSLSRPRTRQDGVRQGASGARAETGVRDWLAAAGSSAGPRRPLTVMFDTRVSQTQHLPKSAASRGRHLLQHLGFTVIAPPRGFLVEGIRGPLLDQEVENAVAWGRGLATSCRHQVTAEAV
ncbi:hypothetical protein [Nocardioides aurantiacus]|uniref:hypothetical protein n=1 Tax=Nocardioides aurantiacus TaxID=86796 RepID=UPI00403EFD16